MLTSEFDHDFLVGLRQILKSHDALTGVRSVVGDPFRGRPARGSFFAGHHWGLLF